jgi:hypothetical protein
VPKEETEESKSKKRKSDVHGNKKTLTMPRWPIEDSEVPHYVKSESSLAPAPVPLKEFTISQELFGDFISIWNFFFVFACVHTIIRSNADDDLGNR